MNHSNYIDLLYLYYPSLAKIIDQAITLGYRPILVGGSVRDYLLGLSIEKINDHDIEVYGCSFDDLEKLLKSFGVVRLTGKSFGVLSLDGLAIDWSIPRVDNTGRKPEVFLDPLLDYQKAFARRDLTINAIGIDFFSGMLIDPYHGVDDLKKSIARSPQLNLFGQDPLRLFRLVHFISRFELVVDFQLEQYCKTMVLGNIAQARIGQEFKKLLLFSRRPSLGLRWLHSIDRLSDLSPQLFDLCFVPQSKQWHPEGNVLEHSFQVLDAAAKIAYSYLDQKKRIIFLYAALFHDIGKKETTVITVDRISSHGHAQKGAEKSIHILKKFNIADTIIKAVHCLIFYHMHPGQYVRTGARDSAYKWLAYNLDDSVSMAMLADLFLADLQGRNKNMLVPLDHPMKEVDYFRVCIEKLGVINHPEKPLLCANDLIEYVQKKELGDLLARAYQIQIDQSIQNKSDLKKIVLMK